MTLDQVQLPKNINIGGRQRSLLEAEEFDMDADLEQRLIAVTHKRSGRRTIITFEGVAMTPAAVAVKNSGQRKTMAAADRSQA